MKVKICPHCKSSNIMKYGTRKTTMGKKQIWICKGCNRRFVLNPIQKIKGNMKAVTMAIDLYMKGISYRGVRDSLEGFLGLKVSHVTIMRWINTYMNKINKHVDQINFQTSRSWEVDEQMVNIKGKHRWVWNCLDKNTRFLIANNLTYSRTLDDARDIFRKARKLTGITKDLIITTDKLPAYPGAIGIEFHKLNDWKHNFSIEHKQVRMMDEINNNKIERYHGSFKQRYKVMRAFKRFETTQKYLENFRTYYNFVRKHQALDGMTPAQASGINEGKNWEELLVKSIS